MSEVLYRKYRPTSFSQIEGQESVVQILKESIIQGKISHAYLFCGPRGCGKTTVARIMSKAVNCSRFAELGDICNECEYCKAVNNGTMDVIEMDAASNRGIEEIRVVRDTVNFMPNFLPKKVYIIDEAHMLTKEAFNALLKTLEEPPEHVVFIMATTESHKLPITILSRVTRFDFKLGSANEILAKLQRIAEQEELNISKDSLKLIFEYSGGSFRDSESLLSKVILTSTDKNISDDLVANALGITDLKYIDGFISAFESSNVEELMTIISTIAKSNDNVPIFLDQLIQNLNNKVIEQVKKGNLNIELINLANLAIKIKNEIRDFSDKSTIVSLALVDYFNKKSQPQTVPQPLPIASRVASIQVEKKPEVVTKVEVKEEVKPKAVEVAQPKRNIEPNIDNFLNEVINRSAEVLPRLKGMLNTSKVEVDANEIRISSPYKFNLSYISKKESRDIISQVAEEIYGKKLGISFSITNEAIPVKEPEFEEKKEPIDDKIIPQKKIDRTIDNSNLVEEIF